MVKPDSVRVDMDGEIDYVIKSNKGKIHDKNKPLKIESVGNEPVHIIDLSKKKYVNPSVANLKRLEALKEQKKDYKYKKSLIHTALSNIDNKSSNKTIFNDDGEDETFREPNNQNGNNRFDLFDGNVSDEDYQGNFDVREEFQTEEGQKLLHLEYRYKNDKRFKLDSRFLDEQERISKQKDENNTSTLGEEITLEEEKKKEYEILEQVLGKRINRKPKLSETDSQRKTMVRFDPTNPEHSKYVMPKIEEKEKRKRKFDNDILNEKKQEEKDMPEVSKEVFYKVSNDLKETFDEKNEFSLRSMFHHTEGTDEEKELPDTTEILGTNFAPEKNPFKYDSSEEENEMPCQKDTIPAETAQRTTNNRSVPGDPFFFRKDDYRLQAGFDFVKKMAVKEVEAEFAEMRRKTMKIVKSKIRNIQKKNQPFKKKLGGNKGRKAMRLKKAMKK